MHSSTTLWTRAGSPQDRRFSNSSCDVAGDASSVPSICGSSAPLHSAAFRNPVNVWSTAFRCTISRLPAIRSSSGPTSIAGDIAGSHSIVARKFSQTLSTSATSYTVTHNLGTQDVMVQVRLAASTFDLVDCDALATSTTQVTLNFAVAPTSNAYRVTVIG